MSGKIMGKKGNWFASVKKALTPNSKRAKKLKKSCIVKPKLCGQVSSSNGTTTPAAAPEPDSGTAAAPAARPPTPPPPPPPLVPREVAKAKVDDVDEEESRQAYSVALATAAAAKAAVAAADAAADVIQLTNASRASGKLKQEIAAIKIQTAFRGYMSRKALSAMKGLVRLKTLIQRQSVKRQTTTTLRCMQTLARVQSQIRMQRIRMSEENLARQRQAQQKHEKRRPRMGGDWDLSVKSKAEVEAKQQQKQEAAMRREKALAYAFTRQQAWRNSLKPSNPSVMDPNNPHWGWSWLERWTEAPRQCESHSTTDCSNQAPVKRPISAAENTRKAHPPAKPPAPAPRASRVQSSSSSSSRTGKVKTKGNQASTRGSGSKNHDHDDESRSEPVDGNAGSSVRDNESPTSVVPNYMTPTEATAAKSRSSSPKEAENRAFGSSRKRLSFPPEQSPPEPRRLSGPPTVDLCAGKHNEEKVANGGKV